MKSTDLLLDDHKHLTAALDVLEQMVARIKADRPLSDSDLKCLLGFLTAFGDRLHQGREESVLFPALLRDRTQKNYPRLCSLVFEHNRQRSLIEGVQESMVTRNRKDFVYYATRLSDILRAHIREEEREIFLLVDSTLSPSEDERVALEMKGYDAAWQENQLATQLRQLADLESAYLRGGLKTA